MQNAFSGTIPLRGDLRIVVRHADSGEVRWRYEIRNSIMYAALKSLVNLIAQKSTTTPLEYKVAYLRLGTGTTPPVRSNLDLQTPAPNAVTPTTLVLGDAQKTLTVSNPYEMKVVATLATTDLNGLNLTEAGLFTYGTTVSGGAGTPAVYSGVPGHYPELFARQVHPPIAKTSAFVVDYDWRISFTS